MDDDSNNSNMRINEQGEVTHIQQKNKETAVPCCEHSHKGLQKGTGENIRRKKFKGCSNDRQFLT